MEKSIARIASGLAALAVSGHGLAQVPGYQVSWGAQGVPLSPWLNVLIVLMLALATYAFIRRRAGRGLMLLAGTLTVGGLAMHTEHDALSVISPTYTIATPSGMNTFECNMTHYLGTTVPGGVTLTVVPYGFNGNTSAAAAVNGFPECTTGLHLNPGGDLCYLCKKA